MKVLLILCAMVACLTGVMAGVAVADSAHAGKSTEITGELVDLGCYVGHAAKGEKHSECAEKCIAGGMPMGLVAGNGRMFVLTMDHANPEAYNKAKKMAGKRVKVTGPVHERNGVKTMDIVAAEIAPAATTASK